ncbi:MAG TPA: hypothetical protein VF633_02975 [Brevundimonas sp.]
MSAPRLRRPYRPKYPVNTDPYARDPWADEFLQACAKLEVMKAFKEACHSRVWATARARGSRCCGQAEFDEAEAMVIAAGHPKPPADWFLWNRIFEADRPNPFNGSIPLMTHEEVQAALGVV